MTFGSKLGTAMGAACRGRMVAIIRRQGGVKLIRLHWEAEEALLGREAGGPLLLTLFAPMQGSWRPLLLC